MEPPLLAAVLIVKNEEDQLAGCLASLDRLRPVLAEVCVYDTGSTDRTCDVAERHGARVERGTWRNDFAAARNAAAAMTEASWILSIDADERIEADAVQIEGWLREGIADGSQGWDVINAVITDVDATGEPLARHPFCKLYRPEYAHWANPLHETVRLIREDRALRVADIPEGVIRFVHHGYANAEARKAKANRNALVAAAALTPEAIAALAPSEVAKRLSDLGRSLRAAGAMEDALERFQQARAVVGVQPETRLIVAQDYVAFLCDAGHHDEAQAVISEMRDLGADPDLVRWLHANLLMAMGRSAEALPLLRQLRTVRMSSTLELDGTAAVRALMGAALDAGEYDEALACCLQLLVSTGDVKRYGAQLMRLWGDQPVDLLARLLADVTPPERHGALRRALESQATWGALAAARLRPGGASSRLSENVFEVSSEGRFP